jgi:DNA-binding GntR family transcriptional regulator
VEHSGDQADVAGVLTDRLAAALVHHEPGWRLPRPTALARRYNVKPVQIEQAVRELTARHLIRQLPDGQLYRASPAEYLIAVQGVPQLGAHVDPMGSEVSCRSRKVSWRRVPEDIGWTLGIAPADAVCTVRCQWSMNGEPAAVSTTYLTKAAASQASDVPDTLADSVRVLRLSSAPQITDTGAIGSALGVPAALHLELQPPSSSVARGLRLSAGQPAVMVTVRFDDPASGRPVALTVAALRADLFRIVIESPAGASGASGAPHASADQGSGPSGPRSGAASGVLAVVPQDSSAKLRA